MEKLVKMEKRSIKASLKPEKRATIN